MVRGILLLCLFLLPAVASGAVIAVGGTGAGLGLLRQLGRDFALLHPGSEVRVAPNLGSGGGLRALLADDLDLAVSARPLREQERGQGLQQEVLGRTPFVFAVPRGSPIASVNVADLVAIYRGERQVWPDGTRIRPVLRGPSDTDTALMQSLSGEMAEALRQANRRPGLVVGITDQDAADVLERVPGAIGPSSLALILAEQRALVPLVLEGVPPTPQEVARGRYRYVKTLYLMTRRRPRGGVRAFLEFIRSPRGQARLEELGLWPDAGGE